MKTAHQLTKDMSKRGNALGFTSTGATICCQFSRTGAWRVWAQPEGVCGHMLAVDTMRGFSDKTQAAEYALSLMDEAKTNELKWW